MSQTLETYFGIFIGISRIIDNHFGFLNQVVNGVVKVDKQHYGHNDRYQK